MWWQLQVLTPWLCLVHIFHCSVQHHRGFRNRDDDLVSLLEYQLQDQEQRKPADYYRDEEMGRRWMKRINEERRVWSHRGALAHWNFNTNITEDTQAKMSETMKKLRKWRRAVLAEGRRFQFKHFEKNLRRQFRLFTFEDRPSDELKAAEIGYLRSMMLTLYDTATACLPAKSGVEDESEVCLPLEPDLEDIMAQSRDPDERLRVWKAWRDAAGRPQRERYIRMVQLLNEGAQENGYSDFSESWQEELFPDKTDVDKMAAGLWKEVRPLYLQLHAFVRRRLTEHYGAEIVGTDGTIPAHLLGNMWGQDWQDIYSIVAPYPEAELSRETLNKRLQSRYGVLDLFRLSETFFVSMGLFNMTDTFWKKSMLIKPKDRDVQCHPSATDLYSPEDYRIKMCAEVTMQCLEAIHHEMGHVEYFHAYSQQPTIFRDSANCAFHETIGDTITLSVLSRTHLRLLGLEESHYEEEEKLDLNNLMKVALIKIAFLPFGLLIDRWRYQVFRNETLPDSYNRDWWKLRLELQGVRAPVPRSEEDFDPAAKFHVVANSAYICYFVSHVAQFQFYKALCDASGHKGPLHLCDFYGSKEAGQLLKLFMASGSSRPWQDILEDFSGSREISAQAIREYFHPLMTWLSHNNRLHSEELGWNGATINWKSD